MIKTIYQVFISCVFSSLLLFCAYADNKLEDLPRLEQKNKIDIIKKPVDKKIKPIQNKNKLEKLYTYTAVFVNSIKPNAEIIDGNKWNCSADKCVAKANWSSPSVKTCNALALAKQQQIKSYGYGVKKLSISQLKQCNQGLVANASIAKMDGINNTASKKSFDLKTKAINQNTGINKNQSNTSINNNSVNINNSAITGLSKNKGLGGRGVNSAVISKIQSKSNAFAILQTTKIDNNQNLKERLNKSRSNPYGGSGKRISGEDCDDTRRDANPNATEICDGIDNNCDGRIDEGQTLPYYLDADGDTHGDPSRRIDACPDEVTKAANEGRWLVRVGNDCDDSDPEIWNNCE